MVRDLRDSGVPDFVFGPKTLLGPIECPRMGLQLLSVTVTNKNDFLTVLGTFEGCKNICSSRGTPWTIYIEYAQKSRILAALERLRALGMRTYYWYGDGVILY